MAVSVKINGNPCTGVTLVNSTTITCFPPAESAGTYDIVVQNGDGQQGTLAASYTAEAAPAISSISPNAGKLASGTACTFSGTGFLASATVQFGSSPATSVVVVSPTQITCVAPSGSGAENVTVQNTDGQTSNVITYTFQPVPQVTSVNPNEGTLAGGESVLVNGSGYLAGMTISFGASLATSVVILSSTQASCVTPAGSGLVNVTVTNLDTQTSAGVNLFEYDATPVVSGCTPNHGSILGGDAVTISGANFEPDDVITFNGVLATSIVFVNAGSMTCVTPPNPAILCIVQVVDEGNVVGGASLFTYTTVVLATPTLTGVLPPSGPTLGGTLMRLTGTNLVSGALAFIGGILCSNINVVSSTEITCVSPQLLPGVYNVTVMNIDNQAATLTQSYTAIAAPQILSITPSSGSSQGGQTVVLTGNFFSPGSTVLFGGVASPSVTYVSSSQLNVVTPAGTGVVSITVIGPDGQQFVYANGYSYSTLYRYESLIRYSNGQAAAGVTVSVTDSTGLAATVYSDASGTPLTTAITTDGHGMLFFYSASGFYAVTVNTNPVQVYTNQALGVGLTPALFRKDLWFHSPTGQALSGVQVFICTQPANTTAPIPPPRTHPVPWGGPNPLATIYLDPQGAQGSVQQPLVTDGFGYCGFYVVPGMYTIVVMQGKNIILVLPDQQVE